MTIKRHPDGPSAGPILKELPLAATHRAAESTVMQRIGEKTMPRGINAGLRITESPAPPGGVSVIDLPLDRVRPLPGFNPRTQFDQDYLSELAESIREKGLLQPITVRPVRCADSVKQNRAFGEDVADHYAIVMGECRWRASRLAGMPTIRAIAEEMDDAEHRERAIVENIQRRQLNPMDEARGYQALRDLGMGVGEIAGKVGRGQPAVSKALGLLTLPASAQASIGGGELSVAQALAIKRYDDHPAVVERLAEAAVRDRIASHTLEKGLPRAVTADLKRHKEAVEFSYDDAFRQAICAKACPFRAYAKDEWGNHLCLNPAHYRELKAEQTRLRQEKDRKTAECAQAVGLLPSLSDLSRDGYEIVGTGSRPSGCTEACPCRGQAVNSSRDTVAICTDPARFKRLRGDDQRAQAEARVAATREAEARVAAVLGDLGSPLAAWDEETRCEEMLRRCTAVVLRVAFSSVEPDRVQEAARALGLDLCLTDYGQYGLQSYGAFLTSLARYGVTDQVRLATSLFTGTEVERLKKGYGQTGALDWLLSPERIPAVWEAEEAAAPPAGLRHPLWDEEGAGLPECRSDGNEARCLRCSQWCGVGDAADRTIWDRRGNGLLVSLFGALITPQGAVYCAGCGPSVVCCRECSCTDEAGCEGGCCWTERDLCSACATRDESAELLAAEVAA